MSENIYGSSTVIVKMFGEFSISGDKNEFIVDLKKQGQLITILQYIVINRNRAITANELIDLIWDKEQIDNPNNALKNLIYRLRNLLAEKFSSSNIELIIHKRGGYMWNDTINTFVDVEEFEHFYAMSHNTAQAVDNQIKYLTKTIECYKGEFLPYSTGIDSINDLRAKYEKMYIDCLHKKAELLCKIKNYNNLLEFTKYNLQNNIIDDKMIYYYFFALINDGRLSDFIKEYEKIKEEYFYAKQLDFPKEIKNLYDEVDDKRKDKIKCNAKELISILGEDAAEGAYYCDYDVFKSYYRLQLRNATRSNIKIVLMIVSVTITNHNNISNLSDIMNFVITSCIDALRKGDAVSQFSDGQIMTLIYGAEVNNVEKISNRIVTKIREYYSVDDVQIEFSVQQVN
ncbi:MAG: winged helix-turn-helix domain-containing protein [Oscillospiraceae bacterium]